MGWWERAACRDLPKTLFVHESMSRAEEREAKAVCAACPVMDECRTFALELADSGRAVDVPVGIWGGTNAAERRAMLTRRRMRSAPRTDEFVVGTRARHGSHNAYREYGCRCPVCVEGQKARWRASYRRRRPSEVA